MASSPNGTLYVGVTSDLVQRVFLHRQADGTGFTARYGCTMLVYYELCSDIAGAITREKQLKAGSRSEKLALIEQLNPQWTDLYPGVLGAEPESCLPWIATPPSGGSQ